MNISKSLKTKHKAELAKLLPMVQKLQEAAEARTASNSSTQRKQINDLRIKAVKSGDDEEIRKSVELRELHREWQEKGTGELARKHHVASEVYRIHDESLKEKIKPIREEVSKALRDRVDELTAANTKRCDEEAPEAFREYFQTTSCPIATGFEKIARDVENVSAVRLLQFIEDEAF